MIKIIYACTIYTSDKFYSLPLYAFKQQNDVIKTINVYFSIFCSLFRFFFLKIDIVMLGPCALA